MNNNYWLSSVKMGGYKSIKSVEIDFQPGLNIIIGKNGTGKTNFLDFLDNSLKMKFQGVRDFCFHSTIFCKGEKIKIEINGEDKEGVETMMKANVHFNTQNKVFSRSIMEKSDDVYFGQITDYFYEQKISLPKARKIDFSMPENIYYFQQAFNLNLQELIGRQKNIKEGSISDIFVKFARQYDKNKMYDKVEMNRNLDSLLSLLDNSMNTKILCKYLQNYTSVQDVRFNSGIFIVEKEKTLELKNLIYEFKVNNDWYLFSDLSDGTKRIIWIIYTLLFAKADIFLLEEPELGIHPHQLDFLMKFLKEQSQEKQIILTTHAPQCLDILTPEELNRIIICDIENKSTKLFHLSEQKMKKARAYMKASDILSSYWRFSDLETRVVK